MLSKSRFYDWRRRYGKANEHNGKVLRDQRFLPIKTRDDQLDAAPRSRAMIKRLRQSAG